MEAGDDEKFLNPHDMKSSNLTEDGRFEWERTAEYAIRVRKIIKEGREKYSPMLLNEKNRFKKMLIRFRRWDEIRRRVNEISSDRNLHAVS